QGARRLPTQAHLRPPADPARSAAGLPRRRPGEGEGVAASARHHRSVRTGPDHREENQSHRGPGPTPGPLGPSNNSNGLTMTPWNINKWLDGGRGEALPSEASAHSLESPWQPL